MPIQSLPEGTELFSYRRGDQEESRFKVIESAGSGTFGNTYNAKDAMFGDICVIKEFAFAELCSRNTMTGVIVPYEGNNSQHNRKRLKLFTKWLDRFELEARNLLKVYHTNVISVRLVWRERGTAFYAMNYIDGKEPLSPTDKDWQAKTWLEVEPIAFELLDALEAVHDVGLIHGDIKPENVLLTSKGKPVLIVRAL